MNQEDEDFDLACSDCGHQGSSVRPLIDDDGDPICPACFQAMMNELVAEGNVESKIGEDGEIYYRAVEE